MWITSQSSFKLQVDYTSEIIEHLRRISFFDNKIFKFRRELVNKKRNVEISGERNGAFKFFMVESSKEIFIKKYCWYFEKNHKVLANLIKEGKEQQEVTNQLVEAGVTGIMNFAPSVLQVPYDVMVNNVNLAIELENLSYFVQQ